MRARAARLADRLRFRIWVTTNRSQRIGGPLVHLPAPVTFNMSQLVACSSNKLKLELQHGAAHTPAVCEVLSPTLCHEKLFSDIRFHRLLYQFRLRAKSFPRTCGAALVRGRGRRDEPVLVSRESAGREKPVHQRERSERHARGGEDKLRRRCRRAAGV